MTVHPPTPTTGPATGPATGGAEARHRIANLLHTYTEIADRKDVAAGVELLGDTTVRFPTDGYDQRSDAEPFFARLWGGPAAHRHDVSNLVVHEVDAGTFRATAHYTRWVFEPEPVVQTLGEYDVLVDARTWTISALTVTRTWVRA
jgi:hypothetical protein